MRSLDLFGDVVGGGSYGGLLPRTEETELFGFHCRIVTLEGSFRLKRAAGRLKDNEVPSP